MAPKNKDLKAYCEKDGWELVRDTDHWYFRKALDNGNILFTKVSHAVHKEIPKQLWSKILKTQLFLASMNSSSPELNFSSTPYPLLGLHGFS